MVDYYLVKPNMSRILTPQTVFLICIEILAVLGILINLSLLDIITDFATFLFVVTSTLLFVVILPDYLKFKAYDKLLFYFYADRVMYNSFAIPYDKIVNVYEQSEAKPIKLFFNKIFNTGTVIIEMYDDSISQNRKITLENISSPKEMSNYIIQLITRYRQIKGTAL